MFTLRRGKLNSKVFNLKDKYLPEETFNYKLKIHNHIKKKGVNINLVDTSPWVNNIVNSASLDIDSGKTIFYDDPTYYITNFPDLSHSFYYGGKSSIKIDGVVHDYWDDNTYYNKGIKVDNFYYIAFSTGVSGVLVKINLAGDLVDTTVFTTHPIRDIDLIKSGERIVIAYYDIELDLGRIIETYLNNISLPVTFFIGEVANISLNKIDEQKLVITYTTEDLGIIQLIKRGNDQVFSVGYPFYFNPEITLFCKSVYVNGNVVVIYYDIDESLKVKNCRLYGDYIGVGLQKILVDNYCYELNIGKFNEHYVYISYYNASEQQITFSLLMVKSDVTDIDKTYSIDDWGEGLALTTVNTNTYVISYVDTDFNSVYRFVFLSDGEFKTINCDYNLFKIDLTNIDLSDIKGHNDYWIYYNNEIIEKGVLEIK